MVSGSALALILSGCGGGGGSDNRSDRIPSGSGDSADAGGDLPIPERMRGVLRNGVRHFGLDIQESTHGFFDGIATRTYAVNGSYLGPTLVLKRGEEVSLDFTNHLPESTTMHGHGMHVPGAMDGTAHQPIAPGATWSARYTVDQRACTNWYHPHALHKTASQVYQGLAGLLIIEDDEIAGIDLPNRYGEDDIPLVLQDRFFSPDRTELEYAPSSRELAQGYIGDYFLVNGAIEPTFHAEEKEIRFRILNGSNSTVYDLAFDDGRSFRQIATDNGLLERPESLNDLLLSPGERAEIVVDFSGEMNSELWLVERKTQKNFLRILVDRSPATVTSLPGTLTTLEAIPATSVMRTFRLGMSGMSTFTINGKTMDMNRIDVALSQGDVEIWEIQNPTGMQHNFHIHGTHFRLISRDGDESKVAPNEKGYKDTVYLPPRSSVRFVLAVPADGVTADAANPYMFHCHFLEHEDHGMMGQYTVL